MDVQTIALLTITGILLLFLIAALFVRRTIIATITGFSWQRKIFLEHYVWVEETSYTGFPEGSRNQERKTERYQSYEMTGMRTNTTTVNGVTTTTTQPVYGLVPRTRIKYTYKIQRWVDSRVLVASEDNHIAYWPHYTLDASTSEREKSREEKYIAHFETAKGKKYQRELPESEWADLDERATCMLKVNLFGHVMSFVEEGQQMTKSS
jgi:hypothetical protein